MQTIGLCRFSYLGDGGFQTMHDTLADREAFLYNADRLEQRFRFFETMTLPSVRGQTDPDFKFLIVIGERFPDAFRRRLDTLIADIPQAIIQVHAPDRHRTVMATAVNSIREFDGKHCIQFRLDDDDAMAVTFVEKAKAVAELALPMMLTRKVFAIDFVQGFKARMGPLGIEAMEHRQLSLGIAQALVLSPRVPKTVMNYGHHKLWHGMPTLTFADDNMWARGYNDFNDSMQKPGHEVQPMELLDTAGEDHFRDTFNIDADHVRRVFSGA
ncbi:glycosyltransferase [Pseudosulfitobacter sp. SM2401]|uniref:glycosyltransferase n=1 Tax=Pseudosulfitobacter sp. SM2401 TaxID=3350098 RepID=UPI0036F1C513